MPNMRILCLPCQLPDTPELDKAGAGHSASSLLPQPSSVAPQIAHAVAAQVKGSAVRVTPAHAQAAEALLRSALEPDLVEHMHSEELPRASQASPCKWHHNVCIAPMWYWCTGCTGLHNPGRGSGRSCPYMCDN